jgi:hypothetical protein
VVNLAGEANELPLQYIYKFVKICDAEGNCLRLSSLGGTDKPRANSSDRFIECQEAIEGQLQELIADAMKAGWTEAETLAAVVEVAENLALGMGADEELRQILETVNRLKQK